MNAATGPGVTEIDVDLRTGWGFRDKLHGGFLLATIVDAALRVTDPELHPHPVAVSATYAAAPTSGPATVVVRPLRAGRTLATLHASLQQQGRPMVEVSLTASRLPVAGTDATWDDGLEPMPTMPDPDHCVGGPHHAASAGQAIGANDPATMQCRLDPAWAPPPYGPGGRGDIRGWVRCTLADPVLAALVLADALPPVTFDLGMAAWVPTLQLQVLLRRLPPAGWLAARQWGTLLAGGLIDETCTLWDPRGRVIAQARQLGAVRA